MNHWFLCARDIMWLVIFILPLLFINRATIYYKENDCKYVDYTLLAILAQFIIVSTLYTGYIK